MLPGLRRLTPALAAVVAIAVVGVGAKTDGARVQVGGLAHLGAFHVPGGIHAGGSANAGFEYGGTGLSYNPANNSLFLVGHDWDQFVGEISIPALGGTARLLQSLTDPSEGRGPQVGSGTVAVGGNLVYNGKLVFTEYLTFDALNVQAASHFTRPLSLATKGAVTGPTRVGPLGAGFYSGYMGLVPAEWQAALGGPALTGNADLNIISRTSFGPSAAAFDPDNMNGTAIELVGYPSEHATLGPWGGANANYAGADRVTGVVMPAGSASVLFFGTHAATFCYGVATADQSKVGTIDPALDPLDKLCYDPTSTAHGVHGYPYSAYVWAYDANALAAVKAGKKRPWEVTPYAVWSLPIGANIGGAAYDAATGRIYVSERTGDGTLPFIHVFAVSDN